MHFRGRCFTSCSLAIGALALSPAVYAQGAARGPAGEQVRPPAVAARPLPPPPPPAEEDTAPPQPAPTEASPEIDLSTAPPPPPQSRERHRHDGFYLRMTSGLDFVNAVADFDDGSELTMRGGGMTTALLIGGTPTPGLAIGGGFWLAVLDEPHTELSSDDPAATFEPVAGVNHGLFGPFIDVHPNPRGGWHFGGAIGVGFIVLPEEDAADLNDDESRYLASGGGAIALFGGYDFWVSTNWSIGPMLRLTMVRTRQNQELRYAGEAQSAYGASTRSVSLLFTALYH